MVAAAQQKAKGPRRKIEATCDLTPPETRRRLCTAIGSMSGWYEISLTPRRNTRSLRQNAFYHAGIVQPFAEFLRDQSYDQCDHEFAHSILKAKFLAEDVINPETGEVLCQRVKSTTSLDTEQMSDYIDRCRAWLLDFFGIITHDPDSWGGIQ